MMNRSNPLRPLILIFIVLNGLFIAGKNVLNRWGIDQEVVITGNLILFAVSVCSFYFHADH